MRWAWLTIPLLLGAQEPKEAKKPSDPLVDFSQSLERLSRRVASSVVQILVTSYAPPSGDAEATETGLLTRQRAMGSGVIVDPEGYVLTNAHVVAGALRVRVSLVDPRSNGGPARQILATRTNLVDAKIVGVDKETDLAVLKIPATKGLRHLAMANSDVLRQGQLVLAFGSPQGLENSVSMGVVSSVARQIKPDDPMIYIQTDAPINPGSSGGPLVDVEGRVVGINTMMLSQSGGSEGIGFSVPSNIARNVYRQIRATGRVHRGEIGVTVQTITPLLATGLKLARNWGVLISDVYPDGPAGSAGVLAGDVIIALNGKPIDNARQLEVNLYKYAGGEEVRLDVLRGKDRLSFTLPVMERQDNVDRLAESVNPQDNLIARLGVFGLDLDRKTLEMLPPLRSASGVLVVAKSSEGQNQESGFQQGDIIRSVNGNGVKSVRDLRTAIDALKADDPVVVQVERNSRFLYLALPFD